MVKASDFFGSDYMKAGHFTKPKLLEITKVAIELLQGDADKTRPVVYFGGEDRGLVLNATNCNTLAEYLGDDFEDWPGNKAVVFPTTCDFHGKQVDCLRVRKPKNQPPAVQEESADDAF